MIKHCVFLRFNPQVTSEDKLKIYQKIADLAPVCKGMLFTEYGPNVSPEGLSLGFEDGFIVNFSDASSRDAYLINPQHQAVGAELVAMLIGGVEGLMVFDLEV